MQDDDASNQRQRVGGNPMFRGLTKRGRTTQADAPTDTEAGVVPSSIDSTAAAAPVPAASLTFRDHMDTARQRWSMQHTGGAGCSEIREHRTADLPRPASAATIVPSPPVRPASSYTHKRAAAHASARPASAYSQHPRPAPPVAAAPVSPAALPLRATNLTHVAKAGVPYAGELFYPFQPQPQQEEEKEESTSDFVPRHHPASLYRHRPLRFYRGWTKCVPARNDELEERIYERNRARGIVPALRTVTALQIRHQPKTVSASDGSYRLEEHARPAAAVAMGQQRPKSAVDSSSRAHQLQLKLQQQHVAAVLSSNALLAARWVSQPHMAHTEIYPPFAAAAGMLSPHPPPAAHYSSLDHDRSLRSHSPQPPPPLLDDKNEFDAQRLLRDRLRRGATSASDYDEGLAHELACNAAPPAGRLNPSGFYCGPGSRGFSTLFPQSVDFGGPVPQGLYVSASAASFGPVDPARVASNLAQATRGPGARVVQMDARAKANHGMAQLMRGNYHQQKTKKKQNQYGRAYEA